MRRPLLIASITWAVLNVAHTLDHARQDRAVPEELRTVGVLGYVSTAVLLVLVWRAHRLAPLYAAMYGVAIVVAFLLIHVGPDWSALSDPYPALDLDALSWVLMIAPALAGAALAAVALPRISRAP